MSTRKEVAVPFLRTAYNYDRNIAGDESGLDTGPESMTKQEFKEECDINTIVRRFGLTGQLPEGLIAPTFGDFEFIGDYQSALNAIYQAQDSFMELPADVRARFENDPQQFVAFCSDAKNREEAEKLGLVFPKKMPDVASGSRQSDAGEPLATPPREGADKAPAGKGSKI